MERENVFHPDDRLPASERSELRDYVHSGGYDRGHMVPSASAWSLEVQHETFALSNMVPQNADNNRGLHAHIEMAVRAFAKRSGELYVITGPLFSGDQIRWLNNRVAIPTQIFKLVYDPRSHRAAAYLEQNAPGSAYKVVSLPDLEALAGIKFMPGAGVTGVLDLPTPTDHGNGFKTHSKSNHSWF